VKNLPGKILLAVLVLTVLTSVTAEAAGPNLVAAFFVKGKVGLKWQKVEGVDEYRVYRKQSSGEFALINTTDEDHYFDTDIAPATTYNYKIAIVGPDGKELFSSVKTVTIPGQQGAFVPPVWVGLRIDQGKIYLNWDPVPTAIAYNIYRSSIPGADYEVIGNTEGSSHADKEGLEAGNTYYYVLTAMNMDFEETPHSAEMSIKFGMSAEEKEQMMAERSGIELEDLTLTHVYDLTEGEEHEPMNQPADIYANSRGEVYVTDALNRRVHCYDANGEKLFTFGEDAGDDPKNYKDGSFKIPFTIYIDKQDRVFVADIGRYDIQMFSADGTFVKRVVVKMEAGLKPLRANGLCVVGDDQLAISDTGNHRFLIIDMEGNILSVKGKQGSAPGEFSFPGEIERSANDELFVVDVINSRVQVLDLAGNFLREFGETGQGAGMFGRPSGIALDAKGKVWVSDNMSSLIQAFTLQGEVKSILGSSQDEWRFVAPRGIHFVGDRLYIVDRLSNKVVVFDLG
jgi:sugar lactone lactonase YvrE